LSRELFALKVTALDKLEDVSDLEYNPDLLTDPDALAAAVDELIAKAPSLRQAHAPERQCRSGESGRIGSGSHVRVTAAAALIAVQLGGLVALVGNVPQLSSLAAHIRLTSRMTE
jgi:hypothetical protein